MDTLETINMRDVRQKEGSQCPAGGSAPAGLGTGVHAGAENEDQCQGRKEETPEPCRIRPTVRKTGGGNRFRQSQNTG